MTDVYFHCSDDEHVFAGNDSVAIDSLIEACEHAHRIVRSYIMTASTEDWHGWVLHATDDFGEEIFSLPFASVVGKPH
jgi:hypothetical protein